MNIVAEPGALAKGEPRESRLGTTLRHYAAFCRAALPSAAPDDASWQRDTPVAAIAIISAAAEEPDGARLKLPSGSLLRMLLMHVFSRALESETAAVDMGDGPAALATDMMLECDAAKQLALAEAYAQLCACKITVSLDGGAVLPVFDARGRPRAPADWRPALRLNSRFFEHLSQHAVELDRRILVALSENPMAMDAYAWIASALPDIGAAGMQPVTWLELQARFGNPDAKLSDVRSHFEQSLQQVSAAWPSVRLIIGEDGVALRRSEREGKPLANIPVATALVDPVEQAIAAPALVEPVAPRAVAPSAPPPAPIHEPAAMQADEAAGERYRPRSDRISLKSHLTGLQQVVWLLRGGDGDEVIIEVTPGSRYDPQNVTVLALEPIIVQISGGLYTRDFERMAAWVNSNRDLIDDVWYEDVELDEEILGRVKKVPPPGWR